MGKKGKGRGEDRRREEKQRKRERTISPARAGATHLDWFLYGSQIYSIMFFLSWEPNEYLK